MTKRKRILAAAIGATVLAASVQGATVYDNFTLVPWTVTRIGIGPIVHEANQRLEVAFPSDAREGASYDYFRGGYKGKCLLRGDFDVQLTSPAPPPRRGPPPGRIDPVSDSPRVYHRRAQMVRG